MSESEIEMMLPGTWWRAVQPARVAVAGVAAVLGLASAHACGTPWRVPDAVAAVVLTLLAQMALNLYGASGGANAGTLSPRQQRDAAQMLGMLVAGGGLLLAARSGGGLMVIAGGAALWGLVGCHPVWGWGRKGFDAPVFAVGVWLIVQGADYVQRGAFSGLAAMVGVSLGLLAAGVVRASETKPGWGEALLLALMAHAWVAYWWKALWLPTQAWWALVSWPLSLAGAWVLGRPAQDGRCVRWGQALTLTAALTHGLLLTAAFSAVAWMR